MLTKQQLNCYNMMEDYYSRNGYMPSYDEIAQMLGVVSKNNIHRLVKALEERGAIECIPNKARAIKLLPLPGRAGS